MGALWCFVRSVRDDFESSGALNPLNSGLESPRSREEQGADGTPGFEPGFVAGFLLFFNYMSCLCEIILLLGISPCFMVGACWKNGYECLKSFFTVNFYFRT